MSTTQTSIIRHSIHEFSSTEDTLAVEEPLEIRVSAQVGSVRLSHRIAVTMRTPGDDQELAMGFLFTEGIIRHGSEIEGINTPANLNNQADGNVIQVALKADVKFDLERLKRNFYTTSSCGVCGKASIEAVKTNSAFPIEKGEFRMAKKTLFGLPENVLQVQAIFSETGGLHASALFDRMGVVRMLREDVGRHNALDKAIGSALKQDLVPLSDSGLLVSGRASFELVQKAWMAGIPLLAAVGAPSSLAVELAAEAGITLIGFLRDKKFNVYTHPERIED